MPEPMNVKEPDWLSVKADALIARVEGELGDNAIGAGVIVMMTLTEPATKADAEKWERTCDNCATHCPERTIFFTGQVVRMLGETRVVITFGACPMCKDSP